MKRTGIPRLAVIAGTVLAALAAPPPAGAESAPVAELRYTPEPDLDLHISAPLSGHRRTETEELPAVIVSGDAIVFTNGPAQRLPIVADKHAGTDSGYFRLWVDQNADGIFSTNESSILCEERDGGFSSSHITCLVNESGCVHPVKFRAVVRPRVYDATVGDYRSVCWVRSLSAFCGTLPIGGREMPVAVVDDDADGLVAEYMEGDNRYVAGARFMFAPGPDTNDYSWLPLARTMGFLGGVYDVDMRFEGQVDRSLLKLVFTPASVDMGTLKLAGAGVTGLDLQAPGKALMVSPTDGIVAVPAGTWSIVEIRLREQDVDYQWQSRRPEDRKEITIIGGQTTELKAGGPLKRRFSIRVAWLLNSPFLTLSGSTDTAGTRFTMQGISREQPICWVIRRPGGKTLASGPMQYG